MYISGAHGPKTFDPSGDVPAEEPLIEGKVFDGRNTAAAKK